MTGGIEKYNPIKPYSFEWWLKQYRDCTNMWLTLYIHSLTGKHRARIESEIKFKRYRKLYMWIEQRMINKYGENHENKQHEHI